MQLFNFDNLSLKKREKENENTRNGGEINVEGKENTKFCGTLNSIITLNILNYPLQLYYLFTNLPFYIKFDSSNF